LRERKLSKKSASIRKLGMAKDQGRKRVRERTLYEGEALIQESQGWQERENRGGNDDVSRKERRSTTKKHEANRLAFSVHGEENYNIH